MIVISDSSKIKEIETRDEIVGQGPVYRQELFSSTETGGFSALMVNFRPGARLNFHVHDSEQILYVTAGKGIVATKEKEYVVTPGTIIYIQPGEVHWHGATQDSSFSHLAIQKPGIRLAD